MYVHIYTCICSVSAQKASHVLESKTQRMPYLYRSISAKEPYNSWHFLRKETCYSAHKRLATY